MLRSPRMILDLVPPSYPIRRGGAGTALYARVSIVGDPSRAIRAPGRPRAPWESRGDTRPSAPGHEHAAACFSFEHCLAAAREPATMAQQQQQQQQQQRRFDPEPTGHGARCAEPHQYHDSVPWILGPGPAREYVFVQCVSLCTCLCPD